MGNVNAPAPEEWSTSRAALPSHFALTLVHQAGPHARAGTPRDAAAFGDVVLLAVPYGATPV